MLQASLGNNTLRSLSYSPSHIWRNFGILWAWWVLFVALTIWSTSNWDEHGGKAGFLLIPREKAKKHVHITQDEESQASAAVEKREARSSGASSNEQLIRNTSVFTWKIKYTLLRLHPGTVFSLTTFKAGSGLACWEHSWILPEPERPLCLMFSLSAKQMVL